MKNAFLILDLVTMINQTRSETSDTEIIKAILEHRHDIMSLSLDDLSRISYHSQSSISRFIKKLGYKNYNEFRQDLLISMLKNDQSIAHDHLNPVQIKNNVRDRVNEMADFIEHIDENKLNDYALSFMNYDQIVFVGSELSMAICRLLQVNLIGKGKIVYTLFSTDYQKEFFLNNNLKTLLIVINVENRWMSTSLFDKTIEQLKTNPLYTTHLWTLGDYPFSEYYDDVFCYGKITEHNYGYHELMNYVMLINQLLLRQ